MLYNEFPNGHRTGYDAEVRLVDSSGTVLQSRALSALADATTVNFTPNQAATDSVRTGGTPRTVSRYGNPNRTALYAYYRRVETSD